MRGVNGTNAECEGDGWVIPIWYITMKLCWLEMELVDFFVVGLSCAVFVALAILVLGKALR